jgi:hypothetical protein
MAKITSKEIQEATKLITTFVEICYNLKSLKQSFLADFLENKKLAKRHGLKLLGSGAYRVAYQYNNIVIKIHRREGCEHEILEEVENWNRIKKIRVPHVKALFNPILYNGVIKCKTNLDNHDHHFSISPYVTPLYGNIKKVNKMYKLVQRFAGFLFSDDHSGNFGILNGLPVIIDYQNDDIDCYSNKIDRVIDKNPKVVKKVKTLLTKQYNHMKKLAAVAA